MKNIDYIRVEIKTLNGFRLKGMYQIRLLDHKYELVYNTHYLLGYYCAKLADENGIKEYIIKSGTIKLT